MVEDMETNGSGAAVGRLRGRHGDGGPDGSEPVGRLAPDRPLPVGGRHDHVDGMALAESDQVGHVLGILQERDEVRRGPNSCRSERLRRLRPDLCVVVLQEGSDRLHEIAG